jgi:sugar/nucleoside kinase (ribokinase family)
LKLCVVGDLFLDHVVFTTLGASSADTLGTVRFVGSQLDLANTVRAAEQLGPVETFWGGPAFNTARAVADAALNVGEPGAITIDFLWNVPSPPISSAFGCGAADHLRRASIRPAWFDFPTRTGETASLIDPGGAVREFVVHESRTPSDATLPFQVDADALAIVACDIDLFLQAVQLPEAFDAFVIAGDREVHLLAARVALIAAKARRVTVFGTSETLLKTGLIDSAPRSGSGGGEIEIVGTAGSSDVSISTVGGPLRLLPVAPVERPTSCLGAGDAYAGGYVFARVSGRPIDIAHEIGTRAAARVLAERGPNAPVDLDLNPRFAPLTDRTSGADDEGRFFERVRNAPALVVISGGQTGIDTLALRHASRLGLPSFAVMPRGRLTESGPASEAELAAHRATVLELGSPSFRFRTWASAYVADATLVWDYANSEGSRETVRACLALNRPVLSFAQLDVSDPHAYALRWLADVGARVINFAGNRASVLSDRNANIASEDIRKLLAALTARDLRKYAARQNQAQPRSDTRLRVGFPRGKPQRALFSAFLRSCCPSDPCSPLALAWESPDTAFYCLPSRDLVDALDRGDLDVAFVGSDAFEAHRRYTVFLRTGMFACAVVTVGLADGRCRSGRVCTQYDNFPRRFPKAFENTETHAIRGGAEAWLRLGVVDRAVDTWKTGATALANGLELREWLDNSTLCVASNLPADHPAFVGLVRGFFEWVRDTGVP